MAISDLAKIEGRRYPARRCTQNLAGGVAPIQATNFSVGTSANPDFHESWMRSPLIRNVVFSRK